jgi:hypothetical protein
MRLFTALLLSTVSLSADSLGTNATKLPPPRRQSAVKHAPPRGTSTPTMKMPAGKQNAKKGDAKTPAHGNPKGGAIARAVSGKASKTRATGNLPSPPK